MDWFALTWHTVIMYTVVFLVLRLMGKREIGKLSVLDLVISVMIAEIAVIAIEDPSNHVLEGIYPIIILVLIQLLTAYMSLKSRKIRLAFDGTPSVIIAQGQIYREELRKQRYNLDDLMLQLREQGITSIDDVDFAILETSGKLSIVPKQEQQQDQQQDQLMESVNNKNNGNEHQSIIPPGFRYEMLPIPLIMDGKVQDSNLEKLQKTRFWLKNMIQEKGVSQFKDVLLCTIDHKGRVYVDSSNGDHRR
jgi:uncharacterized membrane protein YcaP (DUF421 family)